MARNFKRTAGPSAIAVALVLAMPLAAQTNPALPKQAKPATSPNAQKPPTGPTAPQSRHYPILLIASGSEPSWSVRIGMKGVERLERQGYPPIVLEPAEVLPDTNPNAWVYHAKDTAASADVLLHLSREGCTSGASDVKYTFRVELEHSLIGALKGCARVAPEQFPEFKQKNLDDDDPEKIKPGPPPITGFKMPTAVAYLDASGRVVLKRGTTPRVVAPKGSQLSLSHDGKRLLFTREDAGGNTVLLFDLSTGKTTELLKGLVQEQQAFWSPDDSRIAFLKSDGTTWHIWTAPSGTPEQAAQLSATPITHLEGWADAHTVVGANADSFLWITDDGGTAQVISVRDLFGPFFDANVASAVRVSPVNPDLLLVSGTMPRPLAGSPSDPKTGSGAGLFLYEIKSKRRSSIPIPEVLPSEAEWSADSLQIFFTAREPRRGTTAVNRVFWDGSEPKRYVVGSGLVVGQ